jgi:UPF0755 protein
MKQRARGSLKPWIRVAAVTLVLATVAFAVTAWWANRWFETPIGSATTIEVRHGESFNALTDRLAAQDVIGRPGLWRIAARITDQARRVQAGEYRLRAQDTPAEFMARLVSGDVVTYEVRLLEGWTVRQLLEGLAAQEPLRHTLTGAAATDVLARLNLGEGNGEGRFFPDTYRYVRGDSDADVLIRAHRKMADVLEAEWAVRAIGLPYESRYEALIVASLVEKETGQDSERADVAQVFVRRLERRMRLQTDPSVIYGLGSAFDGNLTRAHLRARTPYNTYVHKGLPPTPIAAAGRSSIVAALQPGEGDYLYFVARGDGSSQFSSTLEDHLDAVRRYQLNN